MFHAPFDYAVLSTPMVPVMNEPIQLVKFQPQTPEDDTFLSAEIVFNDKEHIPEAFQKNR